MWDFLTNPPVYLQQAIAVGFILLIFVGGSLVLVLRFGGVKGRVANTEKDLAATNAYLEKIAEIQKGFDKKLEEEKENLKRELKKDFDDQIANQTKDFTKQMQSIIQTSAIQQHDIQTRLDKAMQTIKDQAGVIETLQSDSKTDKGTIGNLNKRLSDVENDQKTLQTTNEQLIDESKEKDALISLYREELRKCQATSDNQAIREKAMMDLMTAFGKRYTELLEREAMPSAALPKAPSAKKDNNTGI